MAPGGPTEAVFSQITCLTSLLAVAFQRRRARGHGGDERLLREQMSVRAHRSRSDHDEYTPQGHVAACVLGRYATLYPQCYQATDYPRPFERWPWRPPPSLRQSGCFGTPHSRLTSPSFPRRLLTLGSLTMQTSQYRDYSYSQDHMPAAIPLAWRDGSERHNESTGRLRGNGRH